MATIELSAVEMQDAYRVSIKEYVTFREQGYLVVRGLVSQDDVAELNTHMDDLLAGRERIPEEAFSAFRASYPQKPEDWLRVHMLHRLLPIHERFLLHPRILDVLEAIIGPDVLALQTMLFFKQPGASRPGLPSRLVLHPHPAGHAVRRLAGADHGR